MKGKWVQDDLEHFEEPYEEYDEKGNYLFTIIRCFYCLAKIHPKI